MAESNLTVSLVKPKFSWIFEVWHSYESVCVTMVNGAGSGFVEVECRSALQASGVLDKCHNIFKVIILTKPVPWYVQFWRVLNAEW